MRSIIAPLESTVRLGDDEQTFGIAFTLHCLSVNRW